MPKISIREDRGGGRAVYSGKKILMSGLGEDEAQNFAAFFRAADRFEGSRMGVPKTPDRRNQTGERSAS